MPRDDTRPTGHMLIDKAALSGEVRRPGQAVRDGDVIATGRGALSAEDDLRELVIQAAKVHGHHTVSRALCVRSPVVLEFAAWVQGREHAGACEVAEASAKPRGQEGCGHGLGIPVPDSGLVDAEVSDMLRAIMLNPRVLSEFSEWLTFTRGGV